MLSPVLFLHIFSISGQNVGVYVYLLKRILISYNFIMIILFKKHSILYVVIGYSVLVKSSQVWEHVPRRHFAALTFLLHSLGLFRATARVCARPVDHSFI